MSNTDFPQETKNPAVIISQETKNSATIFSQETKNPEEVFDLICNQLNLTSEDMLTLFNKWLTKHNQTSVPVSLEPEIVQRVWYEGNFLWKCMFKGDQRHGQCEAFFPNGRRALEYNYKEGQLNGLCKMFREDRDLFWECLYENNKRNGEYKEYFRDRTGYHHLRIQATYTNDVLNGPYNEWGQGASGILQKSKKLMYVNGQLDGMCETYSFECRDVTKLTYKAGKLNGLCEVWSFLYTKNKPYKVEEYICENDMKHGPYRKYFTDGKLSSTVMYCKDKRVGTFRSYYGGGDLSGEDSDVHIECTYEDDILHGPYVEYCNGHTADHPVWDYRKKHIVKKCTYNKGQLTGQYWSRFDDGFGEEGMYENGKKEGKWKEFKAYGESYYYYKEGSYIKGRKSGKWIMHNHNGDVTSD